MNITRIIKEELEDLHKFTKRNWKDVSEDLFKGEINVDTFKSAIDSAKTTTDLSHISTHSYHPSFTDDVASHLIDKTIHIRNTLNTSSANHYLMDEVNKFVRPSYKNHPNEKVNYEFPKTADKILNHSDDEVQEFAYQSAIHLNKEHALQGAYSHNVNVRKAVATWSGDHSEIYNIMRNDPEASVRKNAHYFAYHSAQKLDALKHIKNDPDHSLDTITDED